MTKPRSKVSKSKSNPGAEPHLPGKATTPRKENGKFAKGAPKPATAGRKPGKRNRTTIMLKEAILKAAELCGQDGRGKDGMVGYLRMLASTQKPLFSRLLEKVLPLQLHVKDDTPRTYTPEEATARLKERNLPVPPSLLLLSTTEKSAIIASALNDEREDGETDELDNRVGRERDGLDDLEEDHGDED